MPWSFENETGTDSQGVFETQEKALALASRDPEYAEDLKARGLVILRQFHTGAGQIIDDTIPQHWNPAFPEPVRGKTQMKRLQKQFGTSDFEPKRETKDRLDHFAKKAVHDAEHRR